MAYYLAKVEVEFKKLENYIVLKQNQLQKQKQKLYKILKVIIQNIK
jgi:hypothetical protein